MFYDDVQYDRRGWRNRNRIKTAGGTRWLTIPVKAMGRQEGRILDMQISWDKDWSRDHYRTLRHSYSKAPFFKKYEPMFHAWYSSHPKMLADFTIEITIELARQLGIQHTRFLRSSSLNCSGQKTERLLEILEKVEARTYLSGPSAQEYLDVAMLGEKGISVEWMVYDYPHYPQLHPPFEGEVSVLDLLFMEGDNAGSYIWHESSRTRRSPIEEIHSSGVNRSEHRLVS